MQQMLREISRTVEYHEEEGFTHISMIACDNIDEELPKNSLKLRVLE